MGPQRAWPCVSRSSSASTSASRPCAPSQSMSASAPGRPRPPRRLSLRSSLSSSFCFSDVTLRPRRSQRDKNGASWGSWLCSYSPWRCGRSRAGSGGKMAPAMPCTQRLLSNASCCDGLSGCSGEGGAAGSRARAAPDDGAVAGHAGPVGGRRRALGSHLRADAGRHRAPAAAGRRSAACQHPRTTKPAPGEHGALRCNRHTGDGTHTRRHSKS